MPPSPEFARSLALYSEAVTWTRSSKCDSSQFVEVLLFHKSSFSAGNGACVQVAYNKSSFSGPDGCCVEVGFHKAAASSSNNGCVETRICDCDEILVRDSKNPSGPVLSFTRNEWAAFLAGVKAEEFELPVA